MPTCWSFPLRTVYRRLYTLAIPVIYCNFQLAIGVSIRGALSSRRQCICMVELAVQLYRNHSKSNSLYAPKMIAPLLAKYVPADFHHTQNAIRMCRCIVHVTKIYII